MLSAVRMEYRIGKYIQALAHVANVPMAQVSVALCNEASSEEFYRYASRVQQCAADNCIACIREQASLSSGQPSGQCPLPCKLVQAQTKLDHSQYRDFSPAHLEALANLPKTYLRRVLFSGVHLPASALLLH